jgi:cytochrome c-type biogenesis protein CcmF
MSPDIPGQLLLWFALAANLLYGFAYLKVARGDASFRGLGLKSFRLFVVTTSLAAIYLFYLFISHNFAVKYVYEYSDRSLSFFYELSAFWAGQEGSYMLWLLLSALFGYAVIRHAGRYTNYAMVVYSLVNLFFLSMLVKISPFALLDFPAQDGAGLNPLLQDPWMVVHPPVVFIGYAAAGVPFAIALAALIMNDYSDWGKRVFPWVAVTALMIGAGNILGGYWAYKTLGWGGYWAWDPVENSSFIPWFVSLALLHGLSLEKRTGALRKTNILLAAFVFILVVYGTFLTRSGVLADFSVHSFVDLGINAYLVGFLLSYIALTLVLFVPRIKSLGHQPVNYNIFGRDFFLVAGLLLLFIFAMIVLFWTSLPLTTSVFSSNPRAADIATYNAFALPFAIVFALFLTLSPFAGPATSITKGWKLTLAGSVLLGAVIGVAVMVLVPGTDFLFAVLSVITVAGIAMYLFNRDMSFRLVPAVIALVASAALSPLLGVRNPLHILLIATAVMCIVSNLTILVRLLPHGWRISGAQVTHFGFGIMIIGILGSSAYSTDKQLVLPKGQTDSAFGIDVSYQGMENDIMFPKNKLILALVEGDRIDAGYPQLYYSKRLDGLMKKPYIRKTLLYDLYYSPQQVQKSDDAEGLRLAKGETRRVEDYAFTFLGFSMNPHGRMQSDLQVTAQLQVEYGQTVDTINPSLVAQNDEDGGSRMTDQPDHFGDEQKYSVSIKRVFADEGAVVLSIPGLVEESVPETLVLNVTKEPVINLVWLGTTLILIGSLISYVRRRYEMSA